MKGMSQAPSPLDDARNLLRDLGSRIAIVGASNTPSKYGNIILKNLKARGYQVIPVNPHETTIAGLPVYKSLGDVPKPVDIVNVVTRPEVTRTILRDAVAAGLGLVWLQPGSFDSRVLAETAGAPFRTVHDACIMVEARDVAPVRP